MPVKQKVVGSIPTRGANLIKIMNNLSQDIQKSTDRRIFLSKINISCTNCGETKQIQLVNFLITPAKWKCRICKFKFEFEPILINKHE